MSYFKQQNTQIKSGRLIKIAKSEDPRLRSTNRFLRNYGVEKKKG